MDRDDGQVGVALEAGGGVGALEAVRGRAAVRRQQRRGAERLRGLYADQVVGDRAQVAARAGRAAPRPGSAPPCSRAAAIVASNSSGPASGRAPSCTATTSTWPASMSSASACSAAHSEACRVAPPGTSRTSRSPSSGATASRTASSSPARTPSDQPARRPRAPARRAPSGRARSLSPSGSSTLLVSAPTRVPEPPARITTAEATDKLLHARCTRAVRGNTPSLGSAT